MSEETGKDKEELEKYLTFLEKCKKILSGGEEIEGIDLAKVEGLLTKTKLLLSKLNAAPGSSTTVKEETKDWKKLLDDWLKANQAGLDLYSRIGLVSHIQKEVPETAGLSASAIEWHIKDWGLANKVRIVALEGTSLVNPLFDISSIHIFDWMQPAFQWLDDNYAEVRMNSYEESIKRMRKTVPAVKDVSDAQLKEHIITWAKERKYVMFLYQQNPQGGGGGGISASPEMEKFFAEFKKIATLDYDFSSGNLIFKLDGLSATLGYKAGGGKVTVTADTSEVKVSGEIKTGDVDTSLDVTVDYEGKAKVGATVKINDLFDYFGKKGSVSFSFKGDEKSWSFQMTIASSGGSQAHLSRKAAEEIKNAMNEGTAALKEIYNILQTEPITVDNFTNVKDKIKTHWDKVDKAISALSTVVKEPVKGPEVFVTFGVSGNEETGTSLGANLTFTF